MFCIEVSKSFLPENAFALHSLIGKNIENLVDIPSNMVEGDGILTLEEEG